MINYQVICSLALEIYFTMAIRMLFLYIKLLFLFVFQFFTLFCLLKNKTMGTLRYQYITYPL